MRVRSRRPIPVWFAAAGLCLSLLVVGGHAAFAQTPPPADTPPRSSGVVSDGDRPLRQVTLTDKMIEGVLASQKEFDSVAEAALDQPDPKVAARLEAIARKHGFASYDEYNDAVDTIGLVLSGFDPATKTYVGVESVIRGQIAALEADKSIPEEDREQALEQLNGALMAPAPPIENKANIEVVAKYYDRLNATLQ